MSNPNHSDGLSLTVHRLYSFRASMRPHSLQVNSFVFPLILTLLTVGYNQTLT